MLAHHQSHPHHNHLHRHDPHCDDAEIVVKAPPKHKPLKEEPSIDTEVIPKEESPVDVKVAETTSATPSSKKKQKKNVTFSTVHMREYELIIGDNPDCSFPLSLGWRFVEHESMDLGVYESEHKPRRIQGRLEDRVHVGQLLGLIAPAIDPLMVTTMRPLTLYERRLILRANGHSEQSLRKAERRRRVELALQWASGHFPKQEPYPYSQRFFLNYVL